MTPTTRSPLRFTSQTRLDFDADALLAMGIREAYVCPFTLSSEASLPQSELLDNLALLAEKARKAAEKGLAVYPFFFTIFHPEGNYHLPPRYRNQTNLDGAPRPGFVCFRDPVRQREAIELAARAAELGFSRIAFDDDLRDAFCFCDEHLRGFAPFANLDRVEVATILNDIFGHPEQESLRQAWYDCKRAGMEAFADELTAAVHAVNPACRIGICTSAKRCHDLSGRDVWPWARRFHTAAAPTFIRLCGECYDDAIHHLAQSTGWHHYMSRAYPADLEFLAEITSVPALGYRSPGTVLFEAKAVLAAAPIDAIHWCWVPDIDVTGLDREIADQHTHLATFHAAVPSTPTSPLALYIGRKLGPYMPAEPTPEHREADPMAAFTATALTGLPIVATPTLGPEHQAALCSGYISREMVAAIDTHVRGGGLAVLDAVAAQGYRAFGGEVSFQTSGPHSGHRFEIGPAGERDDLIASCPHDSVYILEVENATATWMGHDLAGDPTGATCVVLPHGDGHVALLGYDLSLAYRTLVSPRWRERLLALLSVGGVTLPVSWSGPVGVQIQWYGDVCAVANFNTNPISGQLETPARTIAVQVPPMDVVLVETAGA